MQARLKQRVSEMSSNCEPGKAVTRRAEGTTTWTRDQTCRTRAGLPAENFTNRQACLPGSEQTRGRLGAEWAVTIIRFMRYTGDEVC